MSEAKKYQTTFTPKALEKGDDGKERAYSGTVTMLIPDWEAQFEFSEVLGEVNAAGALPEDEAEREKEVSRRFKAYIKRVMKQVPTYFVDAKIIRVSDGFELKSWEDITHESALASMLVPELTLWLNKRHLVSDPSKPS